MGNCPSLILRIDLTLGLVFGWEMKRIWPCVLHINYSHISELDVRLLNYPNQTSIAQVMVRLERPKWKVCLARFVRLGLSGQVVQLGLPSQVCPARFVYPGFVQPGLPGQGFSARFVRLGLSD